MSRLRELRATRLSVEVRSSCSGCQWVMRKEVRDKKKFIRLRTTELRSERIRNYQVSCFAALTVSPAF
jgi:hypothetical protein